MRKAAAIAVITTMLFLVAGAVTCFSSAPAQAWEVRSTTDVVVLELTRSESGSVMVEYAAADVICRQAIDEVNDLPFYRPISILTCAPLAYACTRNQPGVAVTLVFYWWSSECHYRWGA